MENSFSSNSITDDHIATKFGTCHDSPAVVPCAKYCSDHFISIWMRAKWNFHHIWIVMEKLLVKWAPAHMGRVSTCQKMDLNSPAAQDNEAACKCLLELDWHGTGSIFRMGSAAFIAKIHIGSINVSAPKPANGFYMYLRYHCTVVKYCGPFSDVQHINRENTFTTGHSPNPGSHFTKDFSIVIKIRWKIDYVAIYFLAITSLQRFAHAATATIVVSCKKYCNDHSVRI